MIGLKEMLERSKKALTGRTGALQHAYIAVTVLALALSAAMLVVIMISERELQAAARPEISAVPEVSQTAQQEDEQGIKPAADEEETL